jgi:hypothetical protein
MVKNAVEWNNTIMRMGIETEYGTISQRSQKKPTKSKSSCGESTGYVGACERIQRIVYGKGAEKGYRSEVERN